MQIRFALPTCGPKSADEFEAYHQLSKDLVCNRYSLSAGIVVVLGQRLLDENRGKRRVKEIQHKLQVSHSIMERNVVGWCICLYFLEEVCKCKKCELSH